LIASVLTLLVVAAGYVGYQAQIQADTVTPGYATAKIVMEISVPQATDISVGAKFTPVATNNQKYYFKNRSFALKAGINLISWYVKKIPGGSYLASLESDLSSFAPPSSQINLITDKVNSSEKFVIDLGLPKIEVEQTQQAQATQEAGPSPITSPLPASTKSVSSPSAPPVPSLDMTATTNPQSAPATGSTDQDIPEIPSLPL